MSTARGAARRTAILDAALRLVARGGPRAVTHRAVAEQAGVPLAATTYYFRSRDDLIAQALLLGAERDLDRLRAQGLTDVLGADPELSIATWELWLEAARNPALRPAARQVSASYLAAARELVDDELDALLLIAALEGLQLEVLVGGLEPELARAALRRLIADRRRR